MLLTLKRQMQKHKLPSFEILTHQEKIRKIISTNLLTALISKAMNREPFDCVNVVLQVL